MHVLVGLLCLSVALTAAYAQRGINRPVLGAEPFDEAQLAGGRHPDDDKRYSIQQLNLAARHRNVYFDKAGSDPYGSSSPVISHLGKRSLNYMQAKGTFEGFNPFSHYVRHQMNVGEKRAYIARLNHAARHRNVYLDNVGSDPYGGSSPVINQRMLIPHRHGRSTQEEKKTSLKERLRLQ